MATNKRDYYEILGVSKSATDDELKKGRRLRRRGVERAERYAEASRV